MGEPGESSVSWGVALACFVGAGAVGMILATLLAAEAEMGVPPEWAPLHCVCTCDEGSAVLQIYTDGSAYDETETGNDSGQAPTGEEIQSDEPGRAAQGLGP